MAQSASLMTLMTQRRKINDFTALDPAFSWINCRHTCTPYLFLEEVLPVFESSQSVLLDLMLQVFTRRLEVANQILQTQTNRIDW